jgi:hypothetical protein
MGGGAIMGVGAEAGLKAIGGGGGIGFMDYFLGFEGFEGFAEVEGVESFSSRIFWTRRCNSLK